MCNTLRYVYVVTIGECFNKRKVRKEIKQIIKNFYENEND